MPRRNLSGYRSMWLFVMFDLPVEDSEDKREYVRFRKRLLAEGFMMVQYSIYARYCPSEEASVAYRHRVKAALPPEGQVRVVSITDRQFGRMEVFFSGKREKPEKKPDQLLLF